MSTVIYTASDVERVLLRHARAILDRTPAGSGGAISHADAECHADALAICNVLDEHGRKLSREADRIAQMAAERAGDYIADHVNEWEGGSDGPSWNDGIRHALDALAAAGLDELTDTGAIADAARRLRREAGA